MIKQNHQWVPTPGRKNSEPSCLVTDKRGSSPVYWWARKARTGSLFGEMVIWKNHEETEDKEGEGISNHLRPLLPLLADHLSARSLSITWIHWNIIKASSKQQMTFIPRAKLLLFPMSILSWFNWANVIFAAYFILRALTHILIYCSYCFWSAWFFPLMQGHFSWALLKRKALHCGKISLSVKRQKMPCWRSEDLFTGDYLNQITCCVLA